MIEKLDEVLKLTWILSDQLISSFSSSSDINNYARDFYYNQS